MTGIRCTNLAHSRTVVFHATADEVRMCHEINLMWAEYDDIMKAEDALNDHHNLDFG